jgi:fumarylacetoacetase
VVLPYGVFQPRGEQPRVGALAAATQHPGLAEDRIIDLASLAAQKRIGADPALFERDNLNAFMAAGPEVWKTVQASLSELAADIETLPWCSAPGVQLLLPICVADYVDFYSSKQHAINMGQILRPQDPPLPDNWSHLPIAYHGRAGTVVVSGTPIHRPWGQSRAPGQQMPSFGPTTRLDIELELGFVIGTPSKFGEPVPINTATDHVFGVSLINDWSARDLQGWEYRPLGPMLSKSFATSMSAWIVPFHAISDDYVLQPPQDPAVLPYLREAPWALDIDLEVELNGCVISRTNTRNLYWSISQQIAHLTVNGACLRTGDLLATGTISGFDRSSRGSLMEITSNGESPIALADGTERGFLCDGDKLTLRGSTRHTPPVQLGEVNGTICASQAGPGR